MVLSFLTAILTAASLLTPCVRAEPGQLTQVREWGQRPTKVDMYIYEPRKLEPKPAIVVVVSHTSTFNYSDGIHINVCRFICARI